MIEEILWTGESAFLAELRAETFRNYASFAIALEPGFNLVFGENAQGKTNLLEAAFLVCSGRMLRGGKDSDAVQQGASRSSIRAEAGSNRETIKVDLAPGVPKRIEWNGNKLRRACDLLGKNPAISLGVGDASVVNGDPSDRRTFLDTELAQLYPAYLSALTHYRRALEQRNALLRRAAEMPVTNDQFHVWESAMAKHGALMRAMRIETIRKIGSQAAKAHDELGGAEVLDLEYAPKDESCSAEDFLERYEWTRNEDIRRGTTTIGPHRDDFLIRIQGREARVFASQGQRRTAMIAIKVGLWRLASEELGRPAILLLDDIFSDLDHLRRSRLSLMLAGHAGQAILTCTEREQAGFAGFEPAASFVVRAGTVNRV